MISRLKVDGFKLQVLFVGKKQRREKSLTVKLIEEGFFFKIGFSFQHWDEKNTIFIVTIIGAMKMYYFILFLI